MRNLICLLFLSISFSFYGQNKNADLYLPPYAEAGKCYMMCFDYNSKVEWLEKSCDSLKYRKPEENLVFKGEKASNYIKSRIKFKKYQDKLISLGYDLESTGYLDTKTVEAHHKYLKDKQKAEKKAIRRRKKIIKDSLKRLKLQNTRPQKEF